MEMYSPLQKNQHFQVAENKNSRTSSYGKGNRRIIQFL